MKYQFYCVVALCFVSITFADVVKQLYEDVFAVSGNAYEPSKTLELLKQLHEKAGSNKRLSGIVGTLLEVSNVSDKKCGFFRRKALDDLADDSVKFVHVAAYVQYCKNLQDQACVDVRKRKSDPFV